MRILAYRQLSAFLHEVTAEFAGRRVTHRGATGADVREACERELHPPLVVLPDPAPEPDDPEPGRARVHAKLGAKVPTRRVAA